MKYKLGDICEIVSGSTPKTSVDEYWDGDVKWITPAELDDDSYVITDSIRKITDEAVKKTGSHGNGSMTDPTPDHPEISTQDYPE